MADDDDRSFGNNWYKVWWGHLLIAIFLLGIALFLNIYIAYAEAQGGRFRVHWLIALLYSWAGKTGTVLIFAIPGGILLITGFWKLLAGGDDTY